MKKLIALGMVLVVLAGINRAADNAEQRPERITASIGTNRVSIQISGGERVIHANGWPDHTPGTFPRRGNPNTIATQNYNFQVPAAPHVAATPAPMRHGVVGVALNGIPFDPSTAEFWNDDPGSGWNYEAKSGFIDLGLDQHNAHVQPNGAYHYHGLPIGLVQKLGGEGSRMLLVGYAADGFPIYTSYGYANPQDTNSALKKMHSSYQLKQGTRPNGPGGKYDGKFTEDYQYVKGSGDLDECNGRFGPTPEYPVGIYHYYITDQFPYVTRELRGTPDRSFQRRPPPPGSGFARRPPPPGR